MSSAVIDYSWLDGAIHRCRCGRSGRWQWRAVQGFFVDHDRHSSCSVEMLTAREERELRLAVGRKRPY